MGSQFAPTNANVYLGQWQATSVFGYDTTELVDRVGLWARYIDDIFIKWLGTKDEFVSFVKYLNCNELGLKLTKLVQKSFRP